MAETPPGLANLKLWMKLNDNAATSVVINEVGDNGVFKTTGGVEKNTSEAHISSGNPPYFNGAFAMEIGETFHNIEVPHSDGLQITGDMSISVFLNKENNFANGFLAKGQNSEVGAGGRSYIFYLWDSYSGYFRPAFQISTDGTSDADKRNYWIANNYVFETASWLHLVITYDNSAQIAKLYLDAVEKTFNKTGAATGTINASTEILHIGRSLASYFYGGGADNLMIFDDILTQNEVSWLTNNERPTAGIVRPLVGGSLAGNSLVGKGLAR